MKKYINESQKGIQNSVTPLNKSTKIEVAYLPNYYKQEEVAANV